MKNSFYSVIRTFKMLKSVKKISKCKRKKTSNILSRVKPSNKEPLGLWKLFLYLRCPLINCKRMQKLFVSEYEKCCLSKSIQCSDASVRKVLLYTDSNILLKILKFFSRQFMLEASLSQKATSEAVCQISIHKKVRYWPMNWHRF